MVKDSNDTQKDPIIEQKTKLWYIIYSISISWGVITFRFGFLLLIFQVAKGIAISYLIRPIDSD